MSKENFLLAADDPMQAPLRCASSAKHATHGHFGVVESIGNATRARYVINTPGTNPDS